MMTEKPNDLLARLYADEEQDEAQASPTPPAELEAYRTLLERAREEMARDPGPSAALRERVLAAAAHPERAAPRRDALRPEAP